jgi:hypothetical protein
LCYLSTLQIEKLNHTGSSPVLTTKLKVMKYHVIMRLKNGKIAEYTTWGNFTRNEIVEKMNISYKGEVAKIIGIF